MAVGSSLNKLGVKLSHRREKEKKKNSGPGQAGSRAIAVCRREITRVCFFRPLGGFRRDRRELKGGASDGKRPDYAKGLRGMALSAIRDFGEKAQCLFPFRFSVYPQDVQNSYYRKARSKKRNV